MRLVIKQSGRFTYLYAVKGYRADEGISTTKVVEKEENKNIIAEYNPKAYIQKGEQHSVDVDIYQDTLSRFETFIS